MKTKDARIVFFGTPHLAVYVLEELHAAGIVPGLIVTAPDRPAGRKLVLTPSPVKVWAEEHAIPFLQPESIHENSDDVALLANSEWDLFIVAAYNKILPKWLLELPTHSVLNVHPSLLPKNRGPSPIRSAICTNDQDAVGVSVIELDTKMDHGPIVAQATVELPEWPVKGAVLDEILFREGGRLLNEVIPKWLKGEIVPEEQKHEEATYTKKIEKSDGEVQLTDDPYENYCKFCAYDGWPGTFFFATEGEKKVRIKITAARYVDGKFVIERVVPEGKKEMDFEVWQKNHSL